MEALMDLDDENIDDGLDDEGEVHFESAVEEPVLEVPGLPVEPAAEDASRGDKTGNVPAPVTALTPPVPSTDQVSAAVTDAKVDSTSENKPPPHLASDAADLLADLDGLGDDLDNLDVGNTADDLGDAGEFDDFDDFDDDAELEDLENFLTQVTK